MYEGVEEFRACLAAILLVEHLPLTELEKDAFALSVFMARFFGFGYEAYSLTSQRRETVREITVGLMFFEWFSKCKIVRMTESGMLIEYHLLRNVAKQAFADIFSAEATYPERNQTALKQIALPWYQLAFPEKYYSPFAKKVYTEIGMKGAKHDQQNV
jgi:hypothetical protein